MKCPTCGGSGLVWRVGGTKRRPRLNDPDPGVDTTAAFACPTCPDDGSGNAIGTGEVPETS